MHAALVDLSTLQFCLTVLVQLQPIHVSQLIAHNMPCFHKVCKFFKSYCFFRIIDQWLKYYKSEQHWLKGGTIFESNFILYACSLTTTYSTTWICLGVSDVSGQWFWKILITIVFSSLERQTPTYSCHNLCIVLYFFEAGTSGTIKLGKETVRILQFKMSKFKWINKILKPFKNQILCHFILSVKIKLIQLNFKKKIYRNLCLLFYTMNDSKQ